MSIVVDSSIFIDFTRAKKGYLPEILALKTGIYIPTVVVAELWSGKSMNNEKEEKLVEKMLAGFKAIDLTKDIAKTTGTLVRNNQILWAFDAVIAATALYLDAQLATRNQRHFLKVPNIRFFKS